MYIPTQEERYSKVARLTLLLCIMVPPGVVMWLAEIADLLTCAYAFLLPVAMPLDWLGFNKVAAICISALIQGIIFFWLARMVFSGIEHTGKGQTWLHTLEKLS